MSAARGTVLAIAVEEYGGSEVLRLVELPDRDPARGEVRVRVHAAAINPVDLMLRDGLLDGFNAGRPFPHVPGMDLAGVVDAIGPGTETELKVGDAVIGIVDNRGGHGAQSELVVLPAASVVAAPDGIDSASAAAFLMNALTARTALDALALPPGGSLLVTGAAGAVGGFALPMAVADGLQVIGAARAADRSFVIRSGARFEASGDDLAARVLERSGGVDAALDTAGLHNAIASAIRDGGQLADLRAWDGDLGRGIRILHPDVRSRATDRAAITAIRDGAQAGILVPRVARTVPAHDPVSAYRAADERGLRGRVVLDLTALRP